MNTNEAFEQWYENSGWYGIRINQLSVFQAGYDAAMREMAEMEPVLHVTSYMANEYGIPEDTPLIPRPTIKGE